MIAALAVLVLASLPLSVTANADEYRVTANRLNVRSLPGPGWPVIGTLEKGQVVSGNSLINSGDWFPVALPDGRTGYASTNFLERVRRDTYNADFLQLLPAAQKLTDSRPLQGVLADAELRERLAPSENGRYVAAKTSGGTGAVSVYDVGSRRMTRTLAARNFAMTNRYLAILVNGLPFMEVIDTEAGDEGRQINASTLGFVQFYDIVAVPDSDIALVHGNGEKGDLIFVDLATGERVGRPLLSRSTESWLAVSRVSDRHALAFSGYNDISNVNGRALLIDLVDRKLVADIPVPDALTGLLYGQLGPEGRTLALRGWKDQPDYSSLKRIVVLDLERRAEAWRRDAPDDTVHMNIETAPRGFLVTQSERTAGAGYAYRHTLTRAATGETIESNVVPHDWGETRSREMPWVSNGGTLSLTASSGSIEGGGSRPESVRFTVRRGRETVTSWTDEIVRAQFTDLLKDDAIRFMVGTRRGRKAMFTWPLGDPSPRTARLLPGPVRWVSAPSRKGERTLLLEKEVNDLDRRQVLSVDEDAFADDVLGPIVSNLEIDSHGPSPFGLSHGITGSVLQVESIAGTHAQVGENSIVSNDKEGDAYISAPSTTYASAWRDGTNMSAGTARCVSANSLACASIFSALDTRVDIARRQFTKAVMEESGVRSIVTFRTPASSPVAARRVAVPIGRFPQTVIADLFEPEEFYDSLEFLPVDGQGNLRFAVKGTPKGRRVPEIGSNTHWVVTATPDGKVLGGPRLLLDEIAYIVDTGFNGSQLVVVTGSNLIVYDNETLDELHRIPRNRDENSPELRDQNSLATQLRVGREVFVHSHSPLEHRIYGLAEGALRATFFVNEQGDAVALTPHGFFSQNRPGAARSIVVRNRDTGDAVPLTAVYDALHRPDLVAAALAGDPNGEAARASDALNLASVIGAGNPPLPSEPRFEGAPANGSVLAAVDLAITDGGIGQVIWRVNGTVVGVDESLRQPASQAGEGRATARRRLPMVKGRNIVSVQATNAEGTVYSDTASAEIQASDIRTSKPNLFVLAVGVNAYEQDDLKLRYSVADAQAIAERMERNEGSAYADVVVHTLLDGDVSREAIADKFAEIGEAIEPDDTFVFYLAGHGITHNGRYYFLPPQISTENGLESAIETYGVRQSDWRAYLSGISALKALVMFDSCESGSAIRMGEVRELEQGTSIAKLSRASGRAIMTAASATQYALEGHEGHGAFTHTLLRAFDEGDANGDSRLGLSEIAAYVERVLPTLTEDKWNYRQEPQIILAGDDFDLLENARQ